MFSLCNYRIFLHLITWVCLLIYNFNYFNISELSNVLQLVSDLLELITIINFCITANGALKRYTCLF